MKSIQEKSVHPAPILRAIINQKLLPDKKEVLPVINKEAELKKILMPQQEDGYIKAKKHDSL